jgi:hypothetical protein
MAQAARARARKAGVPCTIVPQDIFIPDECFACGVAIQPSPGKQGGSAASPSLDRVDRDRGYVRGNVWVICQGCNAAKGHHWNLRFEEAFALYQQALGEA